MPQLGLNWALFGGAVNTRAPSDGTRSDRPACPGSHDTTQEAFPNCKRGLLACDGLIFCSCLLHAEEKTLINQIRK
jgi:hypothetical protein